MKNQCLRTVGRHRPVQAYPRYLFLNNQIEILFLARTAVSNPLVSDTPFINPSPDPRVTGPVGPPGQDIETCKDKKDKAVGKTKNKKKSSKSTAAGSTSTSPSDFNSAFKMDMPGPGLKSLDRSDTVTSAMLDTSTGVFTTGTSDLPAPTGPSMSSVPGSGAISSDTTAASFSQHEPVLLDVEVFPDQSDKDW